MFEQSLLDKAQEDFRAKQESKQKGESHIDYFGAAAFDFAGEMVENLVWSHRKCL
jgi:hypothetical protein